MKSEALMGELEKLAPAIGLLQTAGPAERAATQATILLGIWRTQIEILERLEKLDKVLGDGITLKAKNIYGPN